MRSYDFSPPRSNPRERQDAAIAKEGALDHTIDPVPEAYTPQSLLQGSGESSQSFDGAENFPKQNGQKRAMPDQEQQGPGDESPKRARTGMLKPHEELSLLERMLLEEEEQYVDSSPSTALSRRGSIDVAIGGL
jgi:hypothetical protein